jgi:hypothetical protein
MNKTYLIIIIVLIGLILAGGGYYFLNKEKLVEQDILLTSPLKDELIFSPWLLEGQAKGSWYFEAQFTAELYDDNGNLLGATILTATDDWMSEDFVPFKGELIFVEPTTSSGVLRFLSANPSGLPQNQKVFEVKVNFVQTTPTRKILLYYYNPELDKDEQGNIKCSRDGLVAIEKEVSVNKTSIPDVINLLLKGTENLSAEQKAQGITTEFPLEGLSLEEAVLKADGTLVLTFDDPLNKTSGGSCRVGILWFQIEETAKQFEDVKKVEFLPEELFQP